MPFRKDFRSSGNPNTNPKQYQNQSHPNNTPHPQNNPNNNRGWNQYGSPRQQQLYNNPNNRFIRTNPNPPNRNPQRQNQSQQPPSLFSLIAPLVDYANQNQHVDPDVLQTIQTLQQQCSTENNNYHNHNHHPNDPPPRQSGST